MTREEARRYVQNNYTVKDLKEHLKDRKVKFSHKLSKDQLIELVLDTEEDAE